MNDVFAGGPTPTEFSATTEQLYMVLGENPVITQVISSWDELNGVVEMEKGRDEGEGEQ